MTKVVACTEVEWRCANCCRTVIQFQEIEVQTIVKAYRDDLGRQARTVSLQQCIDDAAQGDYRNARPVQMLEIVGEREQIVARIVVARQIARVVSQDECTHRQNGPSASARSIIF